MNEKTYEIRLASADDIPAIVMIYDAVLTREEQGQYSRGSPDRHNTRRDNKVVLLKSRYRMAPT